MSLETRRDTTWLATIMADTDRAKEAFGIEIAELERGRAVLTMAIADSMVNGFGMTHGGLVFTLADTAFAYACNEDEHVTVASGADITFAKATHAGQTLTATAERRWKSGRNGIYDVSIVDETGETVAEFRGRSFTTNRTAPTGPGGPA
ncbi:hydroxyphenylacetyl-CoA thioesterase PaaI [Agrococcus baldri]|uniref:Phenylacetic acid degradation protein PaaD n=1 Tax=Agrococcus baldri TaxID=153730 RepID=A0AA87URW9_9MICO|nr:hydroxyphenylacetyl-CoA thioesterase PaaI [Agrococcus baldri]GEK79979.1 phenylacetic acid degradation protein PaaD [Agrococcus baldri]